MAAANGQDARPLLAGLLRLSDDCAAALETVHETLFGSDPDPAALPRIRLLLEKVRALADECLEAAERAAPAPVAPKLRPGKRRGRGLLPDGTGAGGARWVDAWDED
jgi:hypothetical protein